MAWLGYGLRLKVEAVERVEEVLKSGEDEVWTQTSRDWLEL